MSFTFSIIAFLIKVTIGLTALTVLLTYTVAWYERANTQPELIERRFTSRGLLIAFWLLLLETGSLITTVILRPLGWISPRMSVPDESSSTRPIILLHGLFQNRSCLLWLQYQLQARGFTDIYAINTPPWKDLESLTEELAKYIDKLKIKFKSEKVILIGHSMGGMIARNYVQNRGGAQHVQSMITLGTPHHGSKLAPFAVSPMGKTLLPNSRFLKKFNSVPWPQEVPATSIYTRYDNIVLPAESSILSGARTVELDGMGHTSMLFHPKAIDAVANALQETPP